MNSKIVSRFKAWWNSPLIQDDIERHIAILMQSLVTGFILVLLFAIAVNETTPSMLTAEEKLSGLIANSIVTLIFVFMFVLIRWGYYRTSIVMLLAVFLIIPSIVILVTEGLQNGSFILVMYTLSAVVAGLGLSRGALVFVYMLSSGIIILAAVMGINQNPESELINITIAGNFILLDGIVSLFVHQFSGALRGALTSANNEILERKKAEENLKETETLYRTLVEQISIVVYRDAPDILASPLYVSPQIENLLGYTQAEWLSEPFFWKTKVYPQDLPKVLEDVENYIWSKESSSIEYRIQAKDGNWFWVRDETMIVKDEEGQPKYVHGVFIDITKRKQAEEALRESEERFRKIFEASPIAICITTVEKGILLDANKAYWEITGRIESESLGKDAEELGLWQDLQEREGFVKELLQKKSLIVRNDYLITSDKSWKIISSFYEWIRVNDQDCILSMFYDQSQQNRLEKERELLIRELEIKNAESETLRESLTSVVSTFRFEDILQQILDQIRRVIPYDTASVWQIDGDKQILVAGRNLPDLSSTDNQNFIIEEDSSALPILRGELPYILSHNVQAELKDFQVPPHNYINSWLAIPLKTRGKILGIIALDGKQKNQFNQHHAELAVLFANQVAIALENSQLFNELQNELNTREKLIKELGTKNAELERFAYTVSHDLKSPLVTINGFLGYLEADIKNNNFERFQHDRERIRDAVIKMHTLLSELLELSRIGRIANPSEYIPFTEIVQSAIEVEYGNIVKHKVTMSVQPNLPTVYGDRQRLIEVVQNLINNAIKFMGRQKKPQIEIGFTEEKDNFATFFVKDNGIGIPKPLQERIFGLFDKLNPESEGTGIGLAIVKRIIEVHAGKVTVESVPSLQEESGQGTTFFFTLPVTEI